MTGSKHTMPTMFLAHGSPMNALEDNDVTRDWQQMAEGLARPKAIVCISAHWETRGTYITSSPLPGTLHDFGGFPQALFDMQYPCPGDPELANRIIEKVSLTDIKADPQRQLDHGVWCLLLKLYPQADIPVVQISLDATQDAAFHFQLGTELAFLREENILLIASGNIAHNIRKWMMEPDGPLDWAIEFDRWIFQAIQRRDYQSIFNYESLAPYAADAVPTPEHFIPLLYCLGAQSEQDHLHTSPFVELNPETSAMRSLRWG